MLLLWQEVRQPEELQEAPRAPRERKVSGQGIHQNAQRWVCIALSIID